MTLAQAETAIENQIRELNSKLTMLRSLRRQLDRNQNGAEPKVRRRPHEHNAEPRVIAMLATATFPVRLREITRKTGLKNSTVCSVLKRKEGYLQRIGKGLYEAGPLFKEWSK